MKTIKNSVFASAFLLSCLIACDSNRVFDSYVSLEDQVWQKENVIIFPFKVADTISKNDLFINIRNNNAYAFSNLFLITEFKFPNGKKIVDTLEYEMADKTGKFLGSGFTEIKENKLFYKEDVVFPSSGDYTVSISQAMRKGGEVKGIEELKGISEVGFRIEKH